MPLAKLITAATSEPVTISDGKLHMRVDHGDEDSYVGGLLIAARQIAEQYTHRVFISQTWEARYQGFAPRMWVPHPPLQSVTSVKYIDANGTEQTVATSVYQVDTFSDPGGIWLAYDQTWPTPRVEPQAVRIRYVAGYGDARLDVPEPIRQAILMLAATLYEHRESVVIGTIVSEMKMPASVEALLGPYRAAGP